MQRLKTRAQFQAVMAGATVSRTAHFALHRCRLDVLKAPPIITPGLANARALFPAQDTWIGALIPKRWAKRAVTRNAIKRQIYTVSQHFEEQLPAAAHVVRLRAAFDRTQFASATSDALKCAVRGELQDLFTRAAP